MSEPYLPVPPPEEDSYHDPSPPLCPIEGCGVILRNTTLAGGGKGSIFEIGTCERHGRVRAIYKDDLRSEIR